MTSYDGGATIKAEHDYRTSSKDELETIQTSYEESLSNVLECWFLLVQYLSYSVIVLIHSLLTVIEAFERDLGSHQVLLASVDLALHFLVDLVVHVTELLHSLFIPLPLSGTDNTRWLLNIQCPIPPHLLLILPHIDLLKCSGKYPLGNGLDGFSPMAFVVFIHEDVDC